MTIHIFYDYGFNNVCLTNGRVPTPYERVEITKHNTTGKWHWRHLINIITGHWYFRQKMFISV